MLHQQGIISPNPQTQFLDDIIQQIQSWRAQHKAILICIDTNDNPQQESTIGVAQIFQETDLHDLHSVKHPHQVCPPTYNQGSQPIDLCAGSPEFVDALQAAGIYHLDYHKD